MPKEESRSSSIARRGERGEGQQGQVSFPTDSPIYSTINPLSPCEKNDSLPQGPLAAARASRRFRPSTPPADRFLDRDHAHGAGAGAVGESIC
jgi:hypothetical protein